MINTPHLLAKRADAGWYYRTLTALSAAWGTRNYAAYQRTLDRANQ